MQDPENHLENQSNINKFPNKQKMQVYSIIKWKNCFLVELQNFTSWITLKITRIYPRNFILYSLIVLTETYKIIEDLKLQIEKNKQKLNQSQKFIENILFHNGVLRFINNKTKNHILCWDTYESNSSSQKNQSSQIKELYRDLESDHAFIQWIFPNFFNSMYNPSSRRLTLEERNEIVANQELTAFYLKNFKMFMRFLGISVEIKKKSFLFFFFLEIYTFQVIDEEQLKRCLFQNTHNRLRLQRVFASLSVLGQRKLALEFLEFLKNTLNRLNAKNIYDREYQHYEMVKEESQQSDRQSMNLTPFKEKKNYYLQQDLLKIWDVDYRILTNKPVKLDCQDPKQSCQDHSRLNYVVGIIVVSAANLLGIVFAYC